MPAESNRVKDLFLAAVNRTPDDRREYLAEACKGDPEFLAAVERLLAAHDSPDSRIDNSAEPPRAIPTGLHVPDAETRDFQEGAPGLELQGAADSTESLLAGRYALLKPIGEGGMGSVWLAQQIEPIKRNVAIKLIKPGMDSRPVLARFATERQALAILDHPNIARVFDAGTNFDGRPFFVMELVEGVPITEYCDQHRLATVERLLLFIQVCRAVQHAHQKGIIHRDLKPSNILVSFQDGKAVPKVIDFGIAKATINPLTEHTLVTGFGAIVGTPEYMSPEQADFNSQDVDTRSDVYALGILLYEMLTGSPPVDRKQLGRVALLEILRIVRELEPHKPSTRLSADAALPDIAARRSTEPRTLTKLIRGDLDCIVMKALEKERERRYESASSLARDVERYLQHQTVEARPQSIGYRWRKFVRRNRRSVIATLVVLVVITYLGINLYASEVRVNDMAHQEGIQRQESFQYLRFMEESLRPDRDNPHLAVRPVLDRAAGTLKDRRLEPLTEARLRAVLGRSYRTWGVYDRAEVELTRAHELCVSHYGSGSLDWNEFDMSLKSDLANLYRELGRHEQAEPMLVDQLTYYRRWELDASPGLWKSRSKGPDVSNCIAAMVSLSECYMEQARFAEAEKLLSEAVQLCRSDRKALMRELHLVWAMGNHARCLIERKAYAEAEGELRECLKIATWLDANDPERAGLNLRLGNALLGQGKYAEAESHLLAAYDEFKKYVGTGTMQKGRRFTDTMDRLIELYTAWGKPTEAAKWKGERDKMLAMPRK